MNMNTKLSQSPVSTTGENQPHYPKHFTGNTLTRVKRMFANEQDYKEHMNNLYRTRAGLLTILEHRPDLNETVGRQFDTLNKLIAALLPDHPSEYPYPPYYV